VLALIGQIPDADIGLLYGHLHEVRDQAGIIARLVDFSARIRAPEEAQRLVAQAFASMASGRRGPAALECAIDVWGKAGEVAPIAAPAPPPAPEIDEDAILAAAKRLGNAKNPLIIAGGGAQGASPEVTALADLLQAPVLSGFRRGRGVLDSRNPFSVTLPIGYELWKETDVVLAVGTRLWFQHRQWGFDDDLDVIAVNSDPEEPSRAVNPAVSLIGDAAPILRRLLDALPARNAKRKPRIEEMQERQAKMRARFAKLAPQLAILAAIRVFVDEVTQMGFVARLAMPVYKPRTYLSPGYQDNLGWGFATALGAQDARRDVPVLSISGDGGFLYTANEMATAMRHRIPLVTVVFADGAFGNVRRIQEENYGNRLIACDLINPDFVKFAESPPRRTDPDRDAGRPDAEPVGVHPHAAGAGCVSGRVRSDKPPQVR
jgi:acetolactate synthase-1/2/3 large subunit